MNKKRSIETEQDLINALEEFVCDVSEDEPIESIDAELQSLGYDPDEIGTKFHELALQALADSPLNWRNRARIELAGARDKLERINKPDLNALDLPGLIDALRQALRKLGYSNPSLAPAQFRNFEQATKSDLVSLLLQVEYLSSGRDPEEDN